MLKATQMGYSKYSQAMGRTAGCSGVLVLADPLADLLRVQREVLLLGPEVPLQSTRCEYSEYRCEYPDYPL